MSIHTITSITNRPKVSFIMAILRKNRLSTASSTDQPTTPPRGPRLALQALFTSSPTSFAAIQPKLSPNSLASFISSATSTTNAASGSSNRFNPKLIFSQIVAIQSIHYLVLSFLFQISYVLTGSTITIDRIFTTKYLNLWSTEGWIDNSAVLLSSIVGAFLLALIVEKSKKCLDFSITLFSVHLIFCIIYDGFPASWDWWIINILGLIVMVLLGEYLCSRVELREIPLL